MVIAIGVLGCILVWVIITEEDRSDLNADVVQGVIMAVFAAIFSGVGGAILIIAAKWPVVICGERD